MNGESVDWWRILRFFVRKMASKRKAPAKKAAKGSDSDDNELVEVLRHEVASAGAETPYDDSALHAVAGAVKAYVSAVVVEAVSGCQNPLARLFFRLTKKKRQGAQPGLGQESPARTLKLLGRLWTP